MSFKRTTIALALAAALLAVAPTAPVPPAAPAAPGAPSVTAAPATTDVPGSWALVSWGFRRAQHSSDQANEPYHQSSYQELAYFGVNLGCGFIGGGVGLLNIGAGVLVGAGCSSGISA